MGENFESPEPIHELYTSVIQNLPCILEKLRNHVAIALLQMLENWLEFNSRSLYEIQIDYYQLRWSK